MPRVLRKAAEIMAVGFLTTMFLAFLLQIFMRYVVDRPLGWTSEACVILYIWAVFWTSAFLLKEEDHVSFTILADLAGARARRLLRLAGQLVLALAFGSALPAIVDYVSFMKIDVTPVTRLRFDLVYAIFPVFAAAVVLRALLGAWRLLASRRGARLQGPP